MAKRPTLTDITAGFGSNTQHNANIDAIEIAFDNTLSRDGSTPNQMEADLDMNSNDILNVNELSATNITLDGVTITATVNAIPAGAIGTTELGDDAVTLGKITAATAGDILYWDALGDPAFLPISTDGLVLTLASGLPSWAAVTVPDDSVTIGKIADANLSGLDTTLITGTAGTAGNLAEWNSDGDLIDSGYTVLDEDDLSSDSDTAVPTQQSVKAYVDTSGGSAFSGSLLHVRDEKADGTAGGGATSGSWETRDLNTVKTNEIAGASVATNQITLPAGTYWIEASAPGNLINIHKIKLANITDATDTIIGCNAANINDSGSAQTIATLRGRFTIAAQKVFELQHRVGATKATDGHGRAHTFGVVEVYSDVAIWKVG